MLAANCFEACLPAVFAPARLPLSAWIPMKLPLTSLMLLALAGIIRADTPVHFANDIVPLFSKYGCNSAGCHGKASGQNGFRLSVFGFDPEADYHSLTHEARGRRVFPASPRNSLI